jgi:hypothetical protein
MHKKSPSTETPRRATKENKQAIGNAEAAKAARGKRLREVLLDLARMFPPKPVPDDPDYIDPFQEFADGESNIDDDNVVWLPPRGMLPDVLRLNDTYAWWMFPASFEDSSKKSWLWKRKHENDHHPRARDHNWGMTNDPEQLAKDFTNPLWKDKCGIGLPTGIVNGLFVIEADTKEGGHKFDGLASLKRLQENYSELPATLMARSPTGSLHHYFQHPGPEFKIKSLDSFIVGYPGIDCKGDGGMVIAPPSKRPDKDGTYGWVNNLPIAEAPAWLLAMVIETVRPETEATADDADNDNAVADGVSLSIIAAALRAFPNTEKINRKQWVDIGMIIKYYYPAKDGLALYLRWSAEWPHYYDDEEKNRKYTIERWGGFKPDGRLKIGTLFDLANQATPGWREEYYERAIDDLANNAPGSDDDAQTQPGDDAQAQPNAGATNSGTGTAQPKPKTKWMQTSAEFVGNFVPPDYLIDGLLQRRFVYSFTGPTGSGKTAIILLIAFHVAYGLSLAGHEVEKGRVLFFAGENPDDVRTRWIKVCEEFGIEPDDVDVVFMPFTLKLSEKQIRKQIDAEATQHGPFSLLIVDTSASYYSGDDENDNKKLGDHARLLRTFVNLPGGPTILVTCHPTKTPDMDNLIPRGGGAFLAEVDGNLACITDRATKVAEVTTHGKFRGPEFAPFNFKLSAGTSDKLRDSKGRAIWTVTASLLTDEELEDIEASGLSDQNSVLFAMLKNPGRSLSGLAEHLGWQTANGEPNKQRVHRIIKGLQKDKLVVAQRGGQYVLTPKGKEEAEKFAEEMAQAAKQQGVKWP